MSYVDVKQSDNTSDFRFNVEMALKELKRKMRKENIFQDLKRKEYYMTPSQRKKFRKQESLKRQRRDEKKKEWFDKNSEKTDL